MIIFFIFRTEVAIYASDVGNDVAGASGTGSVLALMADTTFIRKGSVRATTAGQYIC